MFSLLILEVSGDVPYFNNIKKEEPLFFLHERLTTLETIILSLGEIDLV